MNQAQEYNLFNVYLCKEIFVPSGICYPEKCVSGYLSVRTEETEIKAGFSSGNDPYVPSEAFMTKNYDIRVYLISDDDDEYNLDVFLVPAKEDAICLVKGLSCAAVTDEETDAPWERTGSTVTVRFPQIRTCGLRKIMTVYSPSVVSYKDIGGLREITSSMPEFTQNSEGFLPLETPLASQRLIPGVKAQVFYFMDGYPDYFRLGSFSFQTDIFTSGIIEGCGLTEKIQVPADPENPDAGYTYVHTPVEGGKGFSLKNEWLYDTRLRWLVSYYNKEYWLKSATPCRLNPGTRIGILKSVSSLPFPIDTQIKSTMAKTELSETSDRIVPEYFY